jgi:hypothetical protein
MNIDRVTNEIKELKQVREVIRRKNERVAITARI